MNAARLFPLIFFRLSARKRRMSCGLRHLIGIDRGLPLPSEWAEAEFQWLNAPNQHLICPTQWRFSAAKLLLGRTGLFPAAPDAEPKHS